MSISTAPDVAEGKITLLRIGEGVQQFDLSPGATLADLLREAGADLDGREVMIDGRPIEEAIALRPGMIVSLSRRAESPPDPQLWRSTVGMFKDDPGFAEFIEDVRARRESEPCDP